MKFNENHSKGSRDMDRTRNSRINPMTLNCDPSQHSRVMGSAHRLTVRNIWVKFNENRLKGSRDSERTQNSKVNP